MNIPIDYGKRLVKVREQMSALGIDVFVGTRTVSLSYVAGAFVRAGSLPDAEALWVLVDDVVTTGATAQAALAALGAPPGRGAVLTLCQARPVPPPSPAPGPGTDS